MQLERHGCAFVPKLGTGEDRLDPELLSGVERAIDAAEAADASEPVALVTTGGEDFYSNGYDLMWLRDRSVEEQRSFVRFHQRIMARLLRSAVPSVAALSAHAIGGGALIALAHDYRLTRRDRLSAERALEARVVDELAASEALLEGALVRAEALASKDRRTYGRMKARLQAEVVEALEA